MNTFLEEKALSLVKKQKKSIIGTEYVNVITYNQLIEQYSKVKNPDLLNIDTEDMDLEILMSIDWTKYKPTVICAETASYERDGTERKYDDLISFVESKGYMVFADTRLNTIFVRRDKYVGHD
jgi:hypothetical protein